MPISKEQILAQLRTVNDPELHRDIVTLNMVKDVAYCDGVALIRIELTTPACPLREQIQHEVETAVRALGPEVKAVRLEWSAAVRATPQQTAEKSNPLPGIKQIVAVGAGKGGVGKSTIAVNLAVGLARAGAAVGLLDGDIYGPSAPTLLGLHGLQLQGGADFITPFACHGIHAMTIGAMLGPDKPLIWRGPMAHAAFRDLALKTAWGDLDYLVIDLPPGTGDVPLTMAQTLPLAGAVIVCTPQRVAQDDARRAVAMFQQLDIAVLGVVENMSFFIGDDGKEYDIFGRGGAEQMARELGVPFLGAVPINMALRANSDLGDPTANFTGAPALSTALEEMVRATAGRISIQAQAAPQPTLSVT